jgi:hypothetical protein
MTRFRKLPVEIEAVQWTGDNVPEIEAFVGLAPDCTQYGFGVEPDGTALVYADHERCWVNVPTGHWIVRGALDEYYPISEAALNRTYERVGVTP